MTAVRNPAPERLPAAEQLLLEGGDERIALGAEGINKYGCPPLPDPGLVALGSSTASGISKSGYVAATRLRERLLHELRSVPETGIYAHELERMRHELLELCGLPTHSGAEVIFATSGTDVHFIAAQLASAGETLPTLAIMVEAAESGSHVPAALAGCHTDGAACRIGVAHVNIRLADGTPRPLADVDAEFEALARQAAAQGRRILLVPSDVSKTGMLAPSPACAMRLGRNLDGQLDVLVDACQFRISPATLRAYLEQGFMVALTGSKFVAGPPFSGALLVPAQAAARLRKTSLPAALSARTTRADWPKGWTTGTLPDNTNFGLLLRWEAALDELRAFRSIPEHAVTSFLQDFSSAVQEYLARSQLLQPLPVPALGRQPLSGPASWDGIQTIFPFLLLHPETRRPLDLEQAREVHRLLQLDLSAHAGHNPGGIESLRCQLGQPVACGHPDNMQTGALRLCASARLTVEAAARGNAAVIQKALAALEKAALLAQHLQP